MAKRSLAFLARNWSPSRNELASTGSRQVGLVQTPRSPRQYALLQIHLRPTDPSGKKDGEVSRLVDTDAERNLGGRVPKRKLRSPRRSQGAATLQRNCGLLPLSQTGWVYFGRGLWRGASA